jgi:hypothetical protein
MNKRDAISEIRMAYGRLVLQQAQKRVRSLVTAPMHKRDCAPRPVQSRKRVASNRFKFVFTASQQLVRSGSSTEVNRLIRLTRNHNKAVIALAAEMAASYRAAILTTRDATECIGCTPQHECTTAHDKTSNVVSTTDSDGDGRKQTLNGDNVRRPFYRRASQASQRKPPAQPTQQGREERYYWRGLFE